MFTAGSIVRSRRDLSCAGQITRRSAIKEEHVFFELLVADGSGKRMLPEALLVAGTAALDCKSDLATSRFADPALLR